MYLLFLRLHYCQIVYDNIIRLYITFFQKYDYFIRYYKLRFQRIYNKNFWVYSRKYKIYLETILTLKFIKKYNKLY